MAWRRTLHTMRDGTLSFYDSLEDLQCGYPIMVLDLENLLIEDGLLDPEGTVPEDAVTPFKGGLWLNAVGEPLPKEMRIVDTSSIPPTSYHFYLPEANELETWGSQIENAQQQLLRLSQTSNLDDLKQEHESGCGSVDPGTIADLTKLLVSYAERTSQLFTGGTFIIHDVVDGFPRNLFQRLRNHPDTYLRISSHLHDLPEGQPTQFGIDIPEIYWTVGEAQVVARTVLFCSLEVEGEPYLFYKPEQHGCQGSGSTFSHGIDYIKTRPAVARYFSAANEVYRKERVPKDWQKFFTTKATELGIDARKIKSASKAGLGYMLQALDSVPGDGAEFAEQLRKLAASDLGISEERVAEEGGFRPRIGAEVRLGLGDALEMARAHTLLSHEGTIRALFTPCKMDDPSQASAEAVQSSLIQAAHSGNPVEYLVQVLLQPWATILMNYFNQYLQRVFPLDKGEGDFPQLLVLAMECEQYGSQYEEQTTDTPWYANIHHETAEERSRAREEDDQQVLKVAKQLWGFINAPHNVALKLTASRMPPLLHAHLEFKELPNSNNARALVRQVRELAVGFLATSCFIGPDGFLRSNEARDCARVMQQLRDNS